MPALPVPEMMSFQINSPLALALLHVGIHKKPNKKIGQREKVHGPQSQGQSLSAIVQAINYKASNL